VRTVVDDGRGGPLELDGLLQVGPRGRRRRDNCRRERGARRARAAAVAAVLGHVRHLKRNERFSWSGHLVAGRVEC
jgi:hypothetical protein